jgi:hypothetical protein
VVWIFFSKFSQSASRWDDLIVALAPRRMLAGLVPSAKKRQPAASSSLLILIRAVALYLPFGSSVSPGLFKGHNMAISGTPAIRISDFLTLLSSRQIVRLISYTLQTLIKSQVGKEFDPLPGMPHIGEAESFIASILKPCEFAFKKF